MINKSTQALEKMLQENKQAQAQAGQLTANQIIDHLQAGEMLIYWLLSLQDVKTLDTAKTGQNETTPTANTNRPTVGQSNYDANQRIGNNIKKLREYRNLTPAQMAEKSRINPRAYNAKENGSHDFSISELQGLANILQAYIDVTFTPIQ